MQKTKKPKLQTPKVTRVWLITWESGTERKLAEVERPLIVCMLNARLGRSIMRRILPVLFQADSGLTLAEKLEFSKSKRECVSDGNFIDFGEAPFLRARVVDVSVQMTSDGLQVLRWNEPDRRIEHERRPSEFQPGRARAYRMKSFDSFDAQYIDAV